MWPAGGREGAMQESYSPAFYRLIEEGSLRSAQHVLPHLLELTSPRSIVDVGCGTGTWLQAARDLGVADIFGIDGSYVDRRMLRIPEAHFEAVDLSRPFTLTRTFDVALSLEVAEHLPESSAQPFVESLTRLAPVVLFSAAVPKQVGENHVNEQWPTFWVERFARCGYVAIDCMRRRVWDDPDVEWWYAQNMLLMVRPNHLQGSPVLQQEQQRGAGPCDIVHPRGYMNRLAGAELLRPRGIVEWLAIGPGVAAGTLRRLLRRADNL
jgi:SAM-dependent methyltransferase